MIQLQFINYILSSKDVSLLHSNRINGEFFSDYYDHFNFIKSHIDTYGSIPDLATFVSKFPDFDVIEVTETPEYLLDALYKDRNERKLASVFNKIRELINSGDSETAMSVFKNSQNSAFETRHINCVDLIHDTSRFNDYLEKCSNFETYFLTTGFREIDNILGGWDRKEELATIVARPGVAKCLEKGTEVWMADGSLKKIEDIQVGDVVQSDNGTNHVVALHKGVSNGNRIIPEIGTPFTVSDHHILTLYKYSESRVVDIFVEDWMRLSDSDKKDYALYHPELDFPEATVDIPPYLLGVWIGIGSPSSPEIHSNNPEIVNEIYKFRANQILLAKQPLITCENGFCLSDYTVKLFDKYKLLNNKHIPTEYLKSSKEQRLQLIAGIIDSCGFSESDSILLKFNTQALAKQVRQLFSSVGIILNKIDTIYDNKECKTYYSLSLSTTTKGIPTKVLKVPFKNEHNQISNTTAFTVSPVDRVEYYGFQCDGDHRFLLSDGTLTHNTWVLIKCALAAAQMGLRVGFYSGEMTANKIGYRFDTLNGHISNTGIMRGHMEVQNDYKKYMDSLAENISGQLLVLTPVDLGHPATISDLRAFIENENLDALYVDQHSLLEDENKARDPVTKASNISRDLKNLQVLKKIPIISVSQQNRGKQEEDGALLDVSRIAQADRIGQDSTTVLFLENKDSVLTITIAKARDGGTGKRIRYAIDLDKGIFNYLPTEGDAFGGQECEELREEYDPSIYAEESPF